MASIASLNRAGLAVPGRGEVGVGLLQAGVGRLDADIGPRQFAVLGLELTVGACLHGGDGSQPRQARGHRHHRCGHRRPIPIRPAAGTPPQWLAIRRDRLVGSPSLDVVGQCPAACITLVGLGRYAFKQTASSAGSIEGSTDRGFGNSPLHTARNTAPRSFPSNGGLPVRRQ